jgi:biotin carboxylase
MSENKKTAIVLGGTVPHIELIRQLKQRGYQTILVDYLPDPPAKAAADIHLQDSTLDMERVYEIAMEQKADLVLATCVDHANSTACYVLEKMGKHYPYSYQVSKDVTDKYRMKGIMKAHGIPTADYVVVDDPDAVVDIPFPVVVKPVDSNGSRGIRRVNDQKQLHDSLVGALSASKTARAVVERYVSGVEASVYTYVLHGQAHVILTNQRHIALDEKTGAMPGFSASYPCQAAERMRDTLEQISTRAAQAFHLDNTPLMLQVKIDGDQVYVLELMPRIGGGQSYWNIKKLTGFDMMSAAIDSFEGKEPVIEYHAPAYITVTNNVYTTSGVFDHVENGELLLERGLADEFKVLRNQGTEIVADMSTGNRVCTFIVSGQTWDEVYEKIEESFRLLDVIDTDGRSMMRKDICLRKGM